MKEVINAYRTQKISVDAFLKTFIKSLPQAHTAHALSIAQQYRYIQLIYDVDTHFHQITPVISKREQDITQIGSDKSHYFTKLQLDEDGIYVSNPYIHHKTGKASLSVVHFIDGIYTVFDINLIYLLEDLKLIEYNTLHDKTKRMVYFFGSLLLAFVAVALMAYGGFIFFTLLFSLQGADFLHDIFQSIISITLGLAIYDLAKQIFEHEVIYESFHQSPNKQYKVLGKFLIAIIIALSIETLMVVFKIALEDTSKMLSAFYLLLGTTIMFVGLAYFYKTIQESTPKDEC